MNYTNRIQNLRGKLKANNLEAYALASQESSEGPNTRYLTGFKGSFGITIVTENQALFYTNGIYSEAANSQIKHMDVRPVKNLESLPELLQKLGPKQVGLNASHVSLAYYNQIKEAAPDFHFVACDDFVAELRQVKDQDEINNIRKAQEITDKTFAHILDYMKPGMTEKEIAWEMETFMRKQGADGLAFPIIVASGPNSSLPHHETGERTIQANDFVLFDFGAKWDGYCSDMTRTVCMGTPSDKQAEIYNLVLGAQLASLDAIKAGLQGEIADEAGRSIISNGGYGEQFGHGTGHGVGLEIHEAPSLSNVRKSVLPNQAVVTIEPGIYLEGWGGVRIEDMAVVTENGVENLTKTSKDLIAL